MSKRFVSPNKKAPIWVAIYNKVTRASGIVPVVHDVITAPCQFNFLKFDIDMGNIQCINQATNGMAIYNSFGEFKFGETIDIFVCKTRKEAEDWLKNKKTKIATTQHQIGHCHPRC